MIRQHYLYKCQINSLNAYYSFEDIIGYTDIKKRAINLAEYDVDILILGETGVGKEMFASAIHNSSSRKHKRFVHLDCSTIPSSLFETALFGYRKGAFTDAKDDRGGKIEHANGGTLFLDEIGNIPLDAQAKILRLIENKDICRVGENKHRLIDVRFIFATNDNLINSINKGQFRKDLYYRINFHVITIPPLRKRKKDISKITEYYWQKWNKETNLSLKAPDKEETKILLDYDYSGNIRELIGLLQRAYIAFVEKDYQKRIDFFKKEINALKGNKNLKSLDEKIKEYVREVVNRTKNLSEASRILKIDRKTLRKRLKC